MLVRRQNTVMSSSAYKIAVVNANRVDFDNKVDWTTLGENIHVYTDALGINPTDDEIIERSRDCDVIVTKEIAISESLISRLPDSVRLICEAGTGYNNVALSAARARGISVANVPSYSESAVASLVITFMLALSCGLVKEQCKLRMGDRSSFMKGVPGDEHFELSGKTIGLIGGRGNIGSRVAAVAAALGMLVIISTRTLPLAAPPTGVQYTTSIDELLQRSDFVSIHCPLNTETRNLIDSRALQMMKPSAYLINTARGAIIDESALIDALRSNTIAGAALDVQTVEPPSADNELYTMQNVILTPHIGWKKVETRQRLVETVGENIKGFRSGVPVNIVS